MDFDDYYNILKAKIDAQDYEQNQEMPTKKSTKERKLSQREIFFTKQNKKP
jgi:hypothetical protein